MNKKQKSALLKLALFATGFSGIVAEYNLSTLASYFIGDSVIQWTMIVSVMLFSMGVGSRISKLINKKLLVKFIYIEFLLSILVAFSSLTVFIVYSYTMYSAVVIYFFSVFIGILIGMEIPLVIRINDEYQSLKVNVSSVIEKDYYGSLAGGVFFAFIGLPFLGISYTPFVLGAVNFSVALLLFFITKDSINKAVVNLLVIFSLVTSILLASGVVLSKPVIIHSEQKRYKDKVILSVQSKYQKIVITEWKNQNWLYINNNQQLCTIDEFMYHEPLVHPAAKLCRNLQNVLILGGGDGCAVRELLKYKQIDSIYLVDLDPVMTNLAQTNEVLTDLNKNSLNNPKVKIFNQDGYIFLENNNNFFDLIIVDLPDPRSVELNKLYTYEFYLLCGHRLRSGGTIVTQAGSPYFATKSFECINKTVESAGFTSLPIHNQVVTMGEWGWIIGQKNISKDSLKLKLLSRNFDDIKTKWLNNEAIKLITSFGKQYFLKDTVEVNRIHNPVLFRYYLKGNWDIY